VFCQNKNKKVFSNSTQWRTGCRAIGTGSAAVRLLDALHLGGRITARRGFSSETRESNVSTYEICRYSAGG